MMAESMAVLFETSRNSRQNGQQADTPIRTISESVAMATNNSNKSGKNVDHNQNMYPNQYQPPPYQAVYIYPQDTSAVPQPQPQPYNPYAQQQQQQAPNSYPLGQPGYSNTQFPGTYTMPVPVYTTAFPNQSAAYPSNQGAYGSYPGSYQPQPHSSVFGPGARMKAQQQQRQPTENIRSFTGYVNYNTHVHLVVFEDPKVRQCFIRKVYAVLTLMLLFCSATVFCCIYIQPVKQYILEHPGLNLFFGLSYLVVLLAAGCCCSPILVTHPFDYIYCFIETVLLSGFAGTLAVRHSEFAVVMAACSTAFITLVLTLLAFQTKFDFTGYIGLVFVAVMVVLVFVIIGGILLPLFAGIRIPFLHLIISCVMVLVTCVSIVINTQMLMSDKKYNLEPDHYMLGASLIFSDIVFLFLYLLDIFDYSGNS